MNTPAGKRPSSSGSLRDRDAAIRRAIRRNRRIRRMATVGRVTAWVLLLTALTTAGIAIYRSVHHRQLRRVTIVNGVFVRIEQGRPLPWLEFEPVDLDIPGLHSREVALTGVSDEPVMFRSDAAMNAHIASIYRTIGTCLDRSTLTGASRAVTILETAQRLDADASSGDLIDALIDLSDRFASKQGDQNYMEAWRYLTKANRLVEEEGMKGGKEDWLRRRIERQWFHRVKEHILDGNYRAADTIITELEACGFDHPQVAAFRKQLTERVGDHR